MIESSTDEDINHLTPLLDDEHEEKVEDVCVAPSTNVNDTSEGTAIANSIIEVLIV